MSLGLSCEYQARIPLLCEFDFVSTVILFHLKKNDYTQPIFVPRRPTLLSFFCCLTTVRWWGFFIFNVESLRLVFTIVLIFKCSIYLFYYKSYLSFSVWRSSFILCLKWFRYFLYKINKVACFKIVFEVAELFVLTHHIIICILIFSAILLSLILTALCNKVQ